MHERAISPAIAALRARIAQLEGDGARVREVLPFGVPSLDRKLPGGGLALGCLHEVAGGGNDAVDGAAAACFTAGVAARTTGQVLWCVALQDLFAPGLEQAGLPPARVIFVEAGDDKAALACMEEGLRHGGLGAVVGDVARLPMTASRRLHLAAEGSATLCIALRRWRRQAEASDFGQPTAATTRWRVSALPASPLPVPGVGRARWLVELIRARAGECLDIELEACDAAPPGEAPLVIAGREKNRRVAMAADPAARALGLRAGMPVTKAQAMVPGLHIEPADPRADLDSLERLALWVLQRFSPIVAVDAPDGIVIDATGADHLHGGEAAMLEALTGRLVMSGVTARAAIADSWGAAHALARYAADPLFVAPPGETVPSLAPLPLQALRLPSAIVGG